MLHHLPPHFLTALAAFMGEGEVTKAELVGVPQKTLGLRVDQEQRRSLLRGVRREQVEAMARLKSLTLPHTGN